MMHNEIVHYQKEARFFYEQAVWELGCGRLDSAIKLQMLSRANGMCAHDQLIQYIHEGEGI